MADDHVALDELRRSSKSESLGSRVVIHYNYFPIRQNAAIAAAELRANGFDTEERLGADGSNWLVLAQHKLVMSEEAIARVRNVMEELAQRLGGEYDGWEAEPT